ncbi:uncharacterized protein TRUGW13939_08480 [Talaromyces rugulosus]|uniref:Nephrocystin 3-like N-terminal domain-containing protein n=1 Tax=Talaromyces rugulosus TaxID=121627 RepID=A0A7H8R4Q6_TALRU|nr:uncharacterized protein TRUGW13939_08480 [Talaromyces rugulosus]QKX61332.1 hypothetical protein TRUGW13939_08480 [Talaromyces rugulosus]
MRSKSDVKEDLEILDWLTPANYGPQHSDTFQRRQPGKGLWLLNSSKYGAWLELVKMTLFYPGIPGARKTILTATVVGDLITRFQHNKSVGIAYIHCNFHRQNEQRIEDLLASILKQLSQEQASLPDSVRNLHNRHKIKWTQPSLDDILKTIQSGIALYSKVLIIIDAFRTIFLTGTFNLQAICRVNIFATSRPIPLISERFDHSMTLEIRAHDQDVRNYSNMRILHSESILLVLLIEEIQNDITDVVDGMQVVSTLTVGRGNQPYTGFLLAQLYFNMIKRKKIIRAIRNSTKTLPKGSEAYVFAYKGAMKTCQWRPFMDQLCDETTEYDRASVCTCRGGWIRIRPG